MTDLAGIIRGIVSTHEQCGSVGKIAKRRKATVKQEEQPAAEQQNQ
ncbi:MAG: hypothetical protein O7G86_19970 [Gammaproteobacteria bacterium]|nr:hypothetical protein [Gammaproteobacteria bacterium]